MISNGPLVAVKITHVPTGRVVTVGAPSYNVSVARLKHTAMTILRAQLAAGGDGTSDRLVRSYNGDDPEFLDYPEKMFESVIRHRL